MHCGTGLVALITQARLGNSTDELHDMQHEVDRILREILHSYDDGALEEGDLSAFSLVFEQFHHAITERHLALESTDADPVLLRSRQ